MNGPEFARQLNRRPTPEEIVALQAMIESDEQVLHLLEKQRAEHLTQMERSKALLEDRKKLLKEATKWLTAATQLYKELRSAISVFKSRRSFPSMSPTMDSEETIQSSHRLALSQVIHTRNNALDYLLNHLPSTFDSMKQAQEALGVASESFQAALAIEDRENARLTHLNKQIESFQASIFSNRTHLRASLKVPREIWELIFEDVVRLDGISPKGNDRGLTHGVNALILSWVCHSWRSIMHTLPCLWRYMFISLNDNLEHSLPLLRHYYRMCGNCSPVLVIDAVEDTAYASLASEVITNHTFPGLSKVSLIVPPMRLTTLHDFFCWPTTYRRARN